MSQSVHKADSALSTDRLAFSPVAIPQCTFEEGLQIAAEAGFRGVALRYNLLEDFLSRGNTIADARGLTKQFALSFTEGGFLAEWQFHGGVPLVCGRKRQGGSEERRGVLLQRLQTFLERCAALNCENITAAVALWDSGDLSIAAEDFGWLCDFAKPYGARLCLEFIGQAPQVRDIKSAYQIVSEANRDNGGLVVDTFFIHQGASQLADIAAVPVEKIFNVQLADAKPLPIEKLDMLTDRLFPGDGCARVGEVIRTLVRRGYSGWWTVELFNPDFQTMMPNQVARQAYQSAAGLLAAIESNNAQPFDS